MLLLLHGHVDLPLRERAAVLRGHGLSQDGDQYLLVAGTTEIVVKGAVPGVAKCRLRGFRLLGYN